MSYAHGTSDVTLLGETIGAKFKSSADRFAQREALVDAATGRRYTYRELYAWCSTVARGLLARGVGKGDRVGIWSPNAPEWVATQYATAMIGAILVNINPAYRATEVDYVLRQSGVSTLVAATTVKTSDYRAVIEQVRPGLERLRDVIYIGDESWQRLESDGAAMDQSEIDQVGATLCFDDPINIQYTSGTTGFPKGATLSPPQYIEQRLLRWRAIRIYGR